MNKRILSLVLALVMVLGTFGTVFAASYDDVTGTEVASAVDRLSTLGILEGYPDGTFKPANSITRAEFAAVVARAKGLEAVAVAAKGLATGFTDVTGAHWASGYVGTAARLGIVNGVGNGLFAPEAPVKYEEAVTMIVRALGYEAAAQAKGGYPYGYLIVANDNGLLDDVKGTQGVAATRGLVAQLTDNALEIPMMVQVGFGTEAKFVVSGTKEHGGEEKYLLDELGFESVVGRVVAINTKTDKVTVDPTDDDLKNVTLDVAEGFDFYAVEGLETKFWSKNDTVVVYVVNEEAKFDAVKVDKDELTLVVEDENYDVARGATLTIDGDKVAQDKFVADYAKVVLNDDNEIIWAQGYTLDGFILVEEVKDEVAYSYDEFDELDLEDFTVVKEGKTVAIDAIEEEDVLFFNADEEFAVVYNKGTEGQLDRVYADATFRFEGSAYAKSVIAAPIYFDNGKVGELDEAILADFLDDEVTITVFVDFAGDVVVVSGEVNSVGNSAYAVLTADAVVYAGRKGNMVALDVRNGANEKVSYDVLVADLLDGDVKLTGINAAQVQTLKKADNVVLKFTVDKDGDLTGIELPESVLLKDTFDFDDTNAKGIDLVSYKLQAGTIVFYDSNKKATTLGNAKDVFSEVKSGAKLYVEKGRVVAVVGETDTDADTKNVTGLVTGVKETTNGQLQFTIKVFGVTQRILTESKTLSEATYKAMYANKIATLVVGETSGEIKSFTAVNSRDIVIDSVSGRTINAVTGTAVELNSNAVIYDKDLEVVNLRELSKNNAITVYFQGSSNRFVDYVTVGAPILPPVTTTGVVTYINADALAKVTLPTDANVADYGVLVTGTEANGTTVITDRLATINADKTVSFTFANAQKYTLKLVKLSAPGTVISEITFITNFSAQNVTTLKVVNAAVATGLVNTVGSEAVTAEFDTTAAQLLAALAPVQEGATLKVLGAASGLAVPAATKLAAGMVVEVTAKDTTKVEYAITVKAGDITTLRGVDANIVTGLVNTVGSEAITVAYDTTVAQLLASIKPTDAKATVKVLTAAGATTAAAGTAKVTATMVVEVTAQDDTVEEYAITVEAAPALNTVTTLKSKDLNVTSVNNASGSEKITFVEGPADKTAAQILAAVEPTTAAAGATLKVLSAAGGYEVDSTTEFVVGMVVEVTAEDGTTIVEYVID